MKKISERWLLRDAINNTVLAIAEAEDPADLPSWLRVTVKECGRVPRSIKEMDLAEAGLYVEKKDLYEDEYGNTQLLEHGLCTCYMFKEPHNTIGSCDPSIQNEEVIS